MADWLGSPNYTSGRQGHSLAAPPSYVVIHTMVGTIDSANARFQQPGQQASAHYGVGSNGRVVQWVREQDTAWHAGVWEVNLDSVGIEHEDNGRYNDPRPDALYLASAALVRDICTRYNIPISHSHVGVSGEIAHRETGYATACPDALDVDRIIKTAATGGPELMNYQTKRGLVRIMGLAALGRHFSEKDHDFLAKAIADDASNVDAILASIEDSPEGLAWQTKLATMVQHGPQPGPPYDDTVVRQMITHVQDELDKIKGAIN